MRVFVNYLDPEARPRPVDLVVTRFVLGAGGAAALLTYSPAALASWPRELIRAHEQYGPLAATAPLLPWVQVLTVIGLIMFSIGVLPRLTATVGALGLLYLGAVLGTVSNLKVFLLVAFPLLLFAVHSNTGDRAAVQVAHRRHTVDVDAYRWSLVLVAVIYGTTGIAKLRESGLSWFDAANLRATLLVNAERYLDALPGPAELLLTSGIAATVAAIVTVLAEVGVLVAVVTRRPITLVVVTLLGMHLAIALTMQINYLPYLGMVWLLFVDWDAMLRHARQVWATMRRRTAASVRPTPP